MSYESPTTITIGFRVPHELNRQVIALAARMRVSKSELLARMIRNGTEELTSIGDKAENSIINLGLKIAVNLAGNEEERQEIVQQLDAIAEQRRIRNQEQCSLFGPSPSGGFPLGKGAEGD